MEVSAKNAWGKKNCLTPAFLAHTGFFFKISNYQCPLEKKEKEKKKKLVTVRLRRCLFPSSFYRQTLAPFTLH